MELGQMVFGNETQEVELDDRKIVEALDLFFDSIGITGYGNRRWGENPTIEGDPTASLKNETFVIRPYYWGDCSCGFEQSEGEWESTHPHTATCYKTVVGQARVAAGLVDPNGMPKACPKGQDPCAFYKDEDRRNEALLSDLAAKHGIPYVARHGVCTCNHQADYQAWRTVHNHDPMCGTVAANFEHFPSGLKISWYKYLGRGMSANRPVTAGELQKLLIECRDSLGPDYDSGKPKADMVGTVRTVRPHIVGERTVCYFVTIERPEGLMTLHASRNVEGLNAIQVGRQVSLVTQDGKPSRTITMAEAA